MTYNLKETEKRALQGILAALYCSSIPEGINKEYFKVSDIVNKEELTLLYKLHGILERNDEVTLTFKH